MFVGVGGGITSGERSVRMAIEAENQGAYGVLVNAPMSPAMIAEIKTHVELPVIATIVSITQDIDDRIRAGSDILNVSAAADTPAVVAYIRKHYPDLPLIATGGPTEDSIRSTILAGANAVT